MVFGKRALSLILVVAMVALAAPAMAALDKWEANLKVEAAAVELNQFAGSPDNEVLRGLLKRARAVVLFPGLAKAGLIVGGIWGRGLIIVRHGEEWGPPVFFEMAGGNVGFQIGAEAVDLLMVAVTDQGRMSLLQNKAKVGVGASAAAGPVGRSSEAALAGTSLHDDLYTWSRSQGLFAGVTIEGAGLAYDAEGTAAYYETTQKPLDDAIQPGAYTLPESARRLIEALDKYSR